MFSNLVSATKKLMPPCCVHLNQTVQVSTSAELRGQLQAADPQDFSCAIIVLSNERTLLFIGAIHIDDDKRLLISSHMFALCFSFTDSISWLEFLSCARLVHETGDWVPFSHHFKVSQLNSPNQHATQLVHESGLPLFPAL